MSAFQDMVAADNKAVFLNTDEFAENLDVLYDGITYEKIPMIFNKRKQNSYMSKDYIQGIHSVNAVAHISADDMLGIIPKQGCYIKIEDKEKVGYTYYRDYQITSSCCKMGMITLELEDCDE